MVRAGHRRALASPMAVTPLDGAIPAETIRPPEDRRRDSGAHRQDGIRESAVGRAANPWRVAQAGHRCLGASGLADRREVSATATPDVAHLPHESPRRDRLNGLLHHAHAHGPRVVRAGPPRAPTSSSRPPAVTEHPTAEWTAQQIVATF